MTDEHKRKPEPKRAVADRQERLRQARESAGLKRCEIWARPEHHEQIRAFAKKLDADIKSR